MHLKTIKFLSIIAISVLTVSCDNNIGSGQNNNHIVDLQSILNDTINNKDAKDAHITGIPLTFQCNGINNNQPISLAVGNISNQVNAQKLPANAIFQVGSITKSFTAVVAIQLAEETDLTGKKYFGEKGLDSTVGDVLGESAPSSESWNKFWNDVTLRELLNMTSGIPEYLSNESNDLMILSKYSKNPIPDNAYTDDDILKSVATKDKLFDHGNGWSYSNTGYVIMDKIILAKTHLSTKQQIINRIIAPLKLKHTYYVENTPENAITNISQKSLLMSSYFYMDYYKDLQTDNLKFGTDTKPHTLSWANAAGAIISNTADINTYVRNLFSKDSIILTPEQLKDLTTFVAIQDSKDGKYKAGQTITALDKDTNLGFALGVGGVFIALPEGSAIFYAYTGGTLGSTSQWMYEKDRQASFMIDLNSSHEQAENVKQNIDNKMFTKIFLTT